MVIHLNYYISTEVFVLKEPTVDTIGLVINLKVIWSVLEILTLTQ